MTDETNYPPKKTVKLPENSERKRKNWRALTKKGNEARARDTPLER